MFSKQMVLGKLQKKKNKGNLINFENAYNYLIVWTINKYGDELDAH